MGEGTEKMSSNGWRNSYRRGMPLFERWAKDLRALSQEISARIYHGKRPPFVVTYPDYPSKRASITAIAKKLNAVLTNRQIKADVVLCFDDQTTKVPPPSTVLDLAPVVLNADCLDISKTHVETVHQKVFGYGMAIDPLTFEGTALEKSDTNAMHDGKFIECPIEVRQPGTVYQRVIDNVNDERLAVDLRVPVIGGHLPLVYRKFKQTEVRFTNEVSRTELHPVNAWFSEDEQADIRAFAREIKADFCELDILRDGLTGRMFIIDVNTTPYGPPAKLSPKENEQAIDLLASAFKEAYLT